MLVAAAGAAALGEWFEGGLLLFLFSIGHALEGYAMGRARRAIEALAELAPATARVRRNGQESEIPVEDLRVGDTVVVRPDERIAADGVVVKGTSAVDQAAVTGESVPVDKQPAPDPEAALAAPGDVEAEHRVFAGTLNGSGALDVVVTKPAGETTLARVVQMVSEAETERSPTQRFTDRFEKVFVPSVLALVVGLLFAFLVLDETFAESFYRAMAVLVAASPCALAIATPSAVLSGVARAGRSGVLVKGGGPLEALGGLTAIAFDKTGTLTEGEPRVTDVVPADGATEAELVEAVVAVERLSEHPLARAVVRDLGERATGAAAAEDLQSVTGHGIRATLAGEAVSVGKPDLFTLDGGTAAPEALLERDRHLKADGRSTMLVQRGGRFLGVVGLMDTPREAAKDVIRRLHDLGIEKTIMISGDAQAVASSVGRAVGDRRGARRPAARRQGRGHQGAPGLGRGGHGRRRRQRRPGARERDGRDRDGRGGLRRGARDGRRGAHGRRLVEAPVRRRPQPQDAGDHPAEPVAEPRDGRVPRPGDALRTRDRPGRRAQRGVHARRGVQRPPAPGLQGAGRLRCPADSR